MMITTVASSGRGFCRRRLCSVLNSCGIPRDFAAIDSCVGNQGLHAECNELCQIVAPRREWEPLAHDQVQDDTCGVVHQFLRSDMAQSVAREICPISHSVFLSWEPQNLHIESPLVKFTHLSCCIFCLACARRC
jgi:hypothetical protein